MGQQFFYCQACGTRVTSEDLLDGAGNRTATRVKCVECAKKKTQRKRLDPMPPVEPAVPEP